MTPTTRDIVETLALRAAENVTGERPVHIDINELPPDATSGRFEVEAYFPPGHTYGQAAPRDVVRRVHSEDIRERINTVLRLNQYRWVCELVVLHVATVTQAASWALEGEA